MEMIYLPKMPGQNGLKRVFFYIFFVLGWVWYSLLRNSKNYQQEAAIFIRINAYCAPGFVVIWPAQNDQELEALLLKFDSWLARKELKSPPFNAL